MGASKEAKVCEVCRLPKAGGWCGWCGRPLGKREGHSHAEGYPHVKLCGGCFGRATSIEVPAIRMRVTPLVLPTKRAYRAAAAEVDPFLTVPTDGKDRRATG
jgi:hypothetical protein